MKKELLLTTKNLQQWKAEVNRLMEPYYKSGDYTHCLDDDDWLKDWVGFTPEEFLEEELSNWEP